jgi:protein ImuB
MQCSRNVYYYACIYTPELPVQAALRGEPNLCYTADPVAVLDGPESRQQIISCNKAARDIGIREGMTKSQAAALRNVLLKQRAFQQEEAIHSALMDCGYSISPRLESTCPGTIIIDIAGSQRLLGSPMHIGQQLAARADECGITVHVACATNPDTALYAARGFSDITVIAPGQEARTIASLPIEVLQLEPETAETLNNWGIRNFHSLAKLPVVPLAQRFGQRGLYLRQLARGKVNRKLIAVEPITRFQEGIELDEPVELLEPLTSLLNRLLEQLTLRLKMRSLATDHIQINLELEYHPDRQLKHHSAVAARALFQTSVKIPVPTQDASILAKLLQLHLEEHPPSAPVKIIMVEAFPAAVRFAQPGLYEARAPEPAKLEITMARLRAVVGNQDESGRSLVGFPRVKDSHKPDSFEVLPSPCKGDEKRERRRFVPKLAMRAFRPPLRARVELKDNVPSALIFQGRRKTVSRASGPWRTSGGWWDKAEEWDRSEWDVELSVEDYFEFYRIFHDHQSEQWFVEGSYE